MLMVAMVAVAAVTVTGRYTGIRPLVEVTGSMRPLISPGDLVISRNVRADAVAVGDVVSFRDAARDGVLVTHRVVRVHRTGDILAFETRGDANSGAERWTSPSGAQLGLTIAVLDGVGFAVTALDQPLVAACLVGLITVLLIMVAARRIGRRRA